MARIEKKYIVPITGTYLKRDKIKKAGKEIDDIIGDPSDPVAMLPIFDLRPPLPHEDDPEYDNISKLYMTGWSYSVESIDLDNSVEVINLSAEQPIHDWFTDILINNSHDKLYSDIGKNKVEDVNKKIQ